MAGVWVKYLGYSADSHVSVALAGLGDLYNLFRLGIHQLEPVGHEVFARIDEEGRDRHVLGQNCGNDGDMDAGQKGGL